ncbi:hypothetical protein EKN38_13080 [Enterobacter sp. WCHEn045836]|nr:hypothetical protein EKN38_13080 [Enterobacter sp. WCHEn045836]
MAIKQERAKPRTGSDGQEARVDWFLWRPCTGIGNLCPPLAAWSDMTDGTYSIEEVQMMHDAMDDLIDAADKAKSEK